MLFNKPNRFMPMNMEDDVALGDRRKPLLFNQAQQPMSGWKSPVTGAGQPSAFKGPGNPYMMEQEIPRALKGPRNPYMR